MNWDVLGAIAELLGAVGVIATLAYLAVQIRQNTVHLDNSTRSMRETALLASRSMVTTFDSYLLSDAALTRVFRLGIGASPELNADEQTQFDLLMAEHSERGTVVDAL